MGDTAGKIAYAVNLLCLHARLHHLLFKDLLFRHVAADAAKEHRFMVFVVHKRCVDGNIDCPSILRLHLFFASAELLMFIKRFLQDHCDMIVHLRRVEECQ